MGIELLPLAQVKLSQAKQCARYTIMRLVKSIKIARTRSAV